MIEGNTSGDIGFIAEDSPSISVNEGKAISVQKLATWAILGIKELIEENNKLKDEVLNLKIKFDDLSEELNSSGTKNMSKEELIKECNYLNALIQTILSKNTELNLKIANYETLERININNKVSDDE